MNYGLFIGSLSSYSAFAGASDIAALAVDVSVTCLKHAISNFCVHSDSRKKLATMIFSILLILPKVS